MDDTEDDARYPPKHYSVNNRSPLESSVRSNHSNRNPSYPTNTTYREEENEYEDDELDEEDEGVKQEFDDQDDEEDHEEEDEDDDEEDFENGYDEPGRRQKKRRLENLVSNYEFVPRKPLAAAPAARGRNSSVEWTDQATFVLLEAWGDRFLQLGRKTLRSEDWQDVAEKVSEGSKVDWTDSQCRNRLDTLKKKYKKEKTKIDSTGGGYSSKWVFFRKMDMLLSSSSSKQQVGLPCGIDSGEYVFMNPRVYLNRSNGLDELRDSPGESESSDDDDEDSYGRHSSKGKGDNGESSFKLLADSVHKFGEIYEKIETSKRQQMMELEKIRMNFQRDLEVQKKQILERAQAEIAKIREGDQDETDGSAENISG